ASGSRPTSCPFHTTSIIYSPEIDNLFGAQLRNSAYAGVYGRMADVLRTSIGLELGPSSPAPKSGESSGPRPLPHPPPLAADDIQIADAGADRVASSAICSIAQTQEFAQTISRSDRRSR